MTKYEENILLPNAWIQVSYIYKKVKVAVSLEAFLVNDIIILKIYVKLVHRKLVSYAQYLVSFCKLK